MIDTSAMIEKKRLNIGLIGCGFMGKAHSNAWRQVSHFFDLPLIPHLHTICGRDPNTTVNAQQQWGWQHASTNWQDVTQNSDIDIVDICTPNHTHFDIALAAIKNRKAVLCEKPLATNLLQAEQMLKEAQSAKVTHMICHNYRRVPAISLAKKIIQEGSLGKRIYHFHARYAQDWLSDGKTPATWRLDIQKSGSGSHGDIQAHLIDLSHFLIGDIKRVFANLSTFVGSRPTSSFDITPTQVTVDDCSQMLVEFKSGTRGTFEATRFATGRKNHLVFEINGELGSLYFNLEDMNRLDFYQKTDTGSEGFKRILVTENDHPYAKQYWPTGHILGYEHTFLNTVADFIDAHCKGEIAPPSFIDGVKTQKILELASLSAQEGCWKEV